MKVKELIASRIEAAFDQVGLTGPAVVQTTSSPKLGDFQVNGVMAAAKKAKLDPITTWFVSIYDTCDQNRRFQMTGQLDG